MVEQQQQVRCLVDSGLTHEGGMSRVVGGPSGLPPPPPMPAQGFMWEEGWRCCSDCF